MSKKDYRVRNWKEYNKALIQRGSITLWFSEEMIPYWHSKKVQKGRGRPEVYTDTAIKCALILKAVYSLTFRSTEGFIASLIQILKLEIKIPSYTLLCKRQKTLSIEILKKLRPAQGSLHLVVDTSGLKVFGEGEWKVRQHGFIKHRLWRKLHLGINAQTHEIEAFELTDLGVQDCQGLPKLLEKIEHPIDSVIGDGSYDRFSCYELGEQKKFTLIAPPQRNANLSKARKDKRRRAGEAAMAKRDEVILKAREMGRAEWKVQVGYHKRSLAETAMFRVKTLLGNQLSTRTLEHQKVEIGIWCEIINKMSSLGMPQSIPIN